MFGNIFGVSGTQLLILIVIGVLVIIVMATWYRPLLFASIDPEAAEARGVPVRRLGLVFLLVLALTVTGAAQVVGTLLVLSLAITPAAAAQRLTARPLAVAALSVIFALIAADGGLLASFGASDTKASVFITSISFAIYLTARLTGPLLRDRRRYREDHHGHPGHTAPPQYEAGPEASAIAPAGNPAQPPDSRAPSGLGWPGEPSAGPGTTGLPDGNIPASRRSKPLP